MVVPPIPNRYLTNENIFFVFLYKIYVMFMFIVNLYRQLVDGTSLFFIFKCFHPFLGIFC